MKTMKKLLKNNIAFLVFLFTNTYTHECIYPVDTVIYEKEEYICLMWQDKRNFSLWLWNPKTGKTIKGLSSSYVPTGIVSLPSKYGFSFIDHDRVRVKTLQKRSPRTIDLFGPYDISTICWLNDSTFYFSARERRCFNLFCATTDGDLYRLTTSSNKDYMYPQKVGDALFFITRDIENHYTISQTSYPRKALERDWRDSSKFVSPQEALKIVISEEKHVINPYIKNEDISCVIDFGNRSIAFLSMINDREGFFLEHPPYIEHKDTFMNLTYHKLFYSKGHWHDALLFSFALPLSFLIPENRSDSGTRLYESILPLLPNYERGYLYYVDYNQKTITAYRYTLATGLCENLRILPNKSENILFPAWPHKGKMYIGGSVDMVTKLSEDDGEKKIAFL